MLTCTCWQNYIYAQSTFRGTTSEKKKTFRGTIISTSVTALMH